MSDAAREITIEAFRLLGAIDIVEDAPSEAEMTRALKVFSRMIDGWSANGLNVLDATFTATVASGSKILTYVSDVTRLAPGLNVSGTGIATGSRIQSIDTASQITLDTNATASGSATSVSAALLPMQGRYEESVIAILATRLAPMLRIQPSKQVMDLAKDGWSNLTASFMPTPFVVFDKDLMFTSIRRDSGVITGNG